MDWIKLLNDSRFGQVNQSTGTVNRTTFQRDFDRVVFSSSFRRLQSKTQIFPLPKDDFIHTRLTHSLEASCVGRSLGSIVGAAIVSRNPQYFADAGITSETFAAIVASACLAHDIGNPPFGHSGEDAISSYFESDAAKVFIEGLSEKQIGDLQNFEGNALGFRTLTHTLSAQHEVKGGLCLSCATLGAFTKYPKESLPKSADPSLASERKFGFFQSEKDTFIKIASEMGMIKKSADKGVAFHRHPLAFLVEAADDICYQIMDLEDGCKLNLVSFKRTFELLLEIIGGDQNEVLLVCDTLFDDRERVGYLRAKAINSLVNQCADAFMENHDAVLDGSFDKHLVDCIAAKDAVQAVSDTAVNHIYNHRKVLEIEVAGYEILGGLLHAFLSAVFFDSRHDRQTRELIPKQYLNDKLDRYDKIMNIIQFVSGMTDNFALDTFRAIKGISLPSY